ncbi:HET-domain-containing protein [Apiospora marii]|uniref:HET-domain-containing protein n=1 Tax=Apiospora marii TaxID=335849 RepID=A0ABR1RHU9_9PEZI
MSSYSTSSDKTFKRIQTWLENCCASHASCQSWQTTTDTLAGLPTRLIHIEATPGSSIPTIRLVRGVDASTDRYATLSHCWGPNGVPTKLLLGSINDLSLQIAWDTLPLTFREAILVAARLGIKYIWIDALCIIQDSAPDWNIEASRMMQVYTNCYINISADASTDGSGGLFRQRDPAMFQSFLVPGDRTSKTNLYYCYSDNWYKYVEQTPLTKRSWVVQERFMSPRVVHYSNDQVHWECRELTTSESVHPSFEITPDNTATPWKISNYVDFSIWYRLVHSYTEGQLTKIADRPIAIAGLARTFAHLLEMEPSDYLCGLWRPKLVLELMWYTLHSTERTPLHIPSWSWLSVNGGVWMEGSMYCEPVAEIVEARTASLGDPFGPVVSSSLRIRAPICRATFFQATDALDWDASGRKYGYGIMLGQDKLREGLSFELILDERSPAFFERVLSQDVFILLVQGGVFIDSESPASTELSEE